MKSVRQWTEIVLAHAYNEEDINAALVWVALSIGLSIMRLVDHLTDAFNERTLSWEENPDTEDVEVKE